ncbi:DNA polymerase, beta domain protein region [Roseiflexus sp. RS-1]|nr:DNA polymerase, beta domain protein region [Roseiflexus sp. RS-1]
MKAISLDRDEIIRRLKEVAATALATFPQLCEVRLIGSLATGVHTGTSDVDILLRVHERAGNPIDEMKPYFFFFSQHLEIGIDLLLFDKTPPEGMEKIIQGSILLAARSADTNDTE